MMTGVLGSGLHFRKATNTITYVDHMFIDSNLPSVAVFLEGKN